MTDVKALSDTQLKDLASTRRPRQYLAFDELARRIRNNPSGGGPTRQEPWVWSHSDCTRAPHPREMEWACLKWSQRLNDENPQLEQEQEARLERLERHLEHDPDSLEVKYHNAIGEELRHNRPPKCG